MSKHKVGIVGATGYTGSELVRLLHAHPDVSLELITSESRAGERFSDVHPAFRDIVDMKLQPLSAVRDSSLDLVFLALPHGVSMDFVKKYHQESFKIIDLSGDFRIPDAATYKQWYGKDHVAPDLLAEAVFGLPEMYRTDIRRAKLVANPGCYPTSATLALAPLLKQKMLVEDTIIIDSKSGVTGAGIKAKPTTHFPEVFGNFAAYGLLSHRHTPEIAHHLGHVAERPVQVLFTPHLLPVDRGILSTTYSQPLQPTDAELLQDLYIGHYEKEHFVRVRNSPPSIKAVRGSNYCDIYVTYDERTNRIVTVSVIDNLVKGAAGQAVQNMNIMLDFIEYSGLEHIPLHP